jgi:5-methylthioadenosine/S-adenosylhomocysteine deaminase
MSWLSEKIWPLQEKMTAEDMKLASSLGILENIQCGVTSITDHHKITTTENHTRAVLESAETMGIRLTLAKSWSDTGEGAESMDNILVNLDRLFNDNQSDLVTIANGPLAPWRCSREGLQLSHELTTRNKSVTHIHVAEIQDEISRFLQKYNQTPIAWLEELGILDSNIQLVHSVWVDQDDIKRISQAGSTVIHCPVSNCVLGSGIAPVSEMRKQGIPVLFGTDGPASNDSQDIFETMKTALNLARVKTLDPTVMSPENALSMASAGKKIKEGQPADLIIVNLNHSRAVPVYDKTSALVLCSHGSDVETVICNGKILMQDKKCLFIDELKLYHDFRKAIKRFV